MLIVLVRAFYLANVMLCSFDYYLLLVLCSFDYYLLLLLLHGGCASMPMLGRRRRRNGVCAVVWWDAMCEAGAGECRQNETEPHYCYYCCYYYSLFLFLSRSFSSLSLSLSFALSLSLSLSRALSLTHSLTHSLTQSISISLSPSFLHTLSVSPYPSPPPPLSRRQL